VRTRPYVPFTYSIPERRCSPIPERGQAEAPVLVVSLGTLQWCPGLGRDLPSIAVRTDPSLTVTDPLLWHAFGTISWVRPPCKI
jgi:hypothetical protein